MLLLWRSSEFYDFGVDTSAEEYAYFQRIVSSDESSADGYRGDLDCLSGEDMQLSDQSDSQTSTVGTSTVKRRRCIPSSEDKSGPSNESMEKRVEQHPVTPPPTPVQVSGRSRQG